MLAPQEQQVVDDTIQKLQQCDEFDDEGKENILEEFENNLPEGQLKSFISDVEAILGKYANYDEEDWEDEEDLTDAIKLFKEARRKFSKKNRPDFIPKELAAAYKDVIEGNIIDLEMGSMFSMF